MAVIDPALVRILEVVGDVEVGRAVAIEIGEHGGESKVLRLFGERQPLFVHEAGIVRHGLTDEVPGAVVQVEVVGIGTLLEADPTQVLTVHQPVVTAILLSYFVPIRSTPQTARDVAERALLG